MKRAAYSRQRQAERCLQQGRSSLQAGTAGAGANGTGGITSSDPSYGSVESTSAVKVAVVVSISMCKKLGWHNLGHAFS